MGLDLSPKFPQTFFEGEGGGYYNWSSSDSAVLGQAKVAAGKLVLEPQGFVFPHYADCPKIGFVVDGENGGAGLIFPDRNDKGTATYIGLKKGDIIPIPLGSASWWYNHGPTKLVITFIGETTKACFPGEITYFLLTGSIGTLTAFSSDLIGKSFGINSDKAKEIFNSQKGILIVKLGEDQAKTIPINSADFNGNWTKNIENALPDVAVENGGVCATMTSAEFPLLEEVGLSGTRLVLQNGAVRAPNYAGDGATRVYYVSKGSGSVQVGGFNGKLAFDGEVKAGQLFVVPKYFTILLLAGEEGMECVSMITSPRPVIGELGGVDSMLNINPSIIQIGLNLTSKITEEFKKLMEIGTIIVPPSSPSK